jgi:tRNA nucleotidyltransferase (CCA-adding enzyme)
MNVLEEIMKRTGSILAVTPQAELFPHGADVGVRGIGPTEASAFEQAAVALTMAITDPGAVLAKELVEIACEAPDDGLLLVDWLNAVIYEMAVRRLIFGRYSVFIDDRQLRGRAWGERLDPARHQPAAEPKGATFTALKVETRGDGAWVAQCIVDV